MAFTQEAKGNFTVAVSGPYHCGPNHESPKTFPYRVTVKYPESALDDKGFLLDNTFFQEYFDGLKTVETSCELLVKHCAEFFWDAASGRAFSVCVELWGIPEHAKIEFLKEN